MRDPVVREFLLAFWKIHILHHAAERGVYGQWMLAELHHHGYRLSPARVVAGARWATLLHVGSAVASMAVGLLLAVRVVGEL